MGSEKKLAVLEKYEHWKSVVEGHGLDLELSLDEFYDMNNCNTGSNCVSDSCSGGNGEGCFEPSVVGSSENTEKRDEYIASLVQQLHQGEDVNPNAQS